MNPNKFIYKAQVAMFVILAVLLISSAGWATTYYVDATNGNDGNSGTSQATAWKTISKVNSSSFSPGDRILFKRGEVWREQLVVPSSGSSGNPITFGAYGSGNKPVINGADLVTGWTNESRGTNIYKASLSTECHIVFNGDTKLTENDGNYSSLGNNEWDWHNGYLYVNIGSDPTGESIEAGQRNNCIYIGNGKAYITIDGFALRYSQGGNDNTNAGAINNWDDHNIIKNCDIQYIYGSGIDLKSANNTLIQDTTIKYVNGHVIECYSRSDNVHINGCHLEDSDYFGATIDAAGFIAGGSSGNETTGLIIENCYFKDCISATISTYYTIGAVVRYNLIDHGGFAPEGNSGIAFENSTNPECYGNIITDSFIGINISGSTGAKIYNNTVYNCTSFGLKSSAGGSNWTVINNIFYNNGDAASNYYEVWVTSDTGAIHNNNLYWDDSYDNLIWQGSTAYTKSTITNYEATCVHQDPQFSDEGSRILTLSANSPCIDAGSNIESGCAYHLDPASAWPSSVTTLNQNDCGVGWEIGAFVYKEGQGIRPDPPTRLRIVM